MTDSAAHPSAAAFLDALARRGEPVGAHAVHLVRLLDAHGAAALEVALAETLQRGAARPPRSPICSTSAHAPGRLRPPSPSSSDDPRVRDLRVTPHALSHYDALSKEIDDDEAASR